MIRQLSVVLRQARISGGNVLGYLTLFLLIGGAEALASDSDHCERMNTSEYVSTDRHWVARVYGKVCDLGITSSAAIIVELARTELSDSGTPVFSMSMPSDKSAWPRPQWQSARRLAIAVPSNADIALHMASYQNIEIQVRFCPAEPGVRDRWLAYKAAYHKWIQDMAAWSQASARDPSAAGPKPAQPTPPGGPKPDSTCTL